MKGRQLAAGAVILVALLVGRTVGASDGGDANTPEPMLARADELFDAGKHAEAAAAFEEAAEEALAADEQGPYVEACAMAARSHLAGGDADEGQEWLVRAEAFASESEPAGWSRYLSVRGRFEWKRGDLEVATRTFEELFLFCKQAELWERAVDAANMAAITGASTDRFEWSRKGIEIAERGELTGWLGPLWNNLGWNYYDEGMYTEALHALVRARGYHYTKEAELPRLIADYSVAHVKLKVGSHGEAGAEMTEVLEWATRLDSEGVSGALEWMGLARWDLGEIALASGDGAAGAALLGAALEELEAGGMPDWDPAQWSEKQARYEEVR